jgi:hypothetical protein
MTSPSTIRPTLALLLALTTAPALAEHEGPKAHDHGAKKTVVLDTEDIRPSSIEMGHGDVIEFDNRSTNPMRVEFTEPKDLIDKVRCGAVRDARDKGTPSAPWALFMWDNGKLSADVPPGKFASVCSLAAGHYAFTAEAIGHKGQLGGATGTLPSKGTIDVK